MALVVVAVLAFVALGGGKSTPTDLPGGNVPTLTPLIIPTPTAAPTALLTFNGNGIKNSAPFTASGDTVIAGYTFNCKSFGSSGNFIADLMGADGSDQPIANALALSGNDSSTLYLANTTGPYHVEVNSECSWTVTITGTP